MKKKQPNRIELKTGTKKLNVRASRTGGVNVSTQPSRGITFNSKHGLRLSKSFKGLNFALQGGNFRLRGRWQSSYGTNLNVSKSGISLSQKNSIGTFNISHPQRSSANIGGFQFRGKNAIHLHSLLFLYQSIVLLSRFGIILAKWLSYAILYFLKILWALLKLKIDSLYFCLMEVKKFFASRQRKKRGE